MVSGSIALTRSWAFSCATRRPSPRSRLSCTRIVSQPLAPTISGPWTSYMASCSMVARSASWLSSTASAGSRRRRIHGSRTKPATLSTLERAGKAVGYPRVIRVDNGPEFVSRGPTSGVWTSAAPASRPTTPSPNPSTARSGPNA